MKTQWALVLIAASAASFAGCVNDLEGARCPCLPEYCCRDDVCKSGSDCTVDLAFVPKASNNPVFRVALEGARRAAEALSKDGFNVQVNCRSPTFLDDKGDEQARAIAKALAEQPKGILVSCVSDDRTAPLLSEAMASGIPVLAFDSDCPKADKIGFYGTNNKQMGATAAEILVQAMGNQTPKSVAYLTGSSPSQNLEEREDGFTEHIASHYPERVKILARGECDETPEKCGEVIENDLIPLEPDGLFVMGLWGLQDACSCIDDLNCDCAGDDQMPKWKAAAEGKLKTVAYDTLPFELRLLEDRKLSALISQEYYEWGNQSVRIMFRYITQGIKDIPEPEVDVVHWDELDEAWRLWQPGAFGAELTSACKTPYD